MERILAFNRGRRVGRARDQCAMRTTSPIRLGLRENLAQFSLLVVVNAFVGAMVGMERSILPAIAEQEFHLAARTAVLSFIVVFGVTKALTNYLAGRLADRFGRKHVLVAGWLVAVPVPFLLMWAPSWTWMLVANVAPRRQPGTHLVDDRHHEDRSGRAANARPRDGPQRVRRLRRASRAAALATGWIAARYGLAARAVLPRRRVRRARAGLCRSLVVRETQHHVAPSRSAAPVVDRQPADASARSSGARR